MMIHSLKIEYRNYVAEYIKNSIRSSSFCVGGLVGWLTMMHFGGDTDDSDASSIDVTFLINPGGGGGGRDGTVGAPPPLEEGGGGASSKATLSTPTADIGDNDDDTDSDDEKYDGGNGNCGDRDYGNDPLKDDMLSNTRTTAAWHKTGNKTTKRNATQVEEKSTLRNRSSDSNQKKHGHKENTKNNSSRNTNPPTTQMEEGRIPKMKRIIMGDSILEWRRRLRRSQNLDENGKQKHDSSLAASQQKQQQPENPRGEESQQEEKDMKRVLFVQGRRTLAASSNEFASLSSNLKLKDSRLEIDKKQEMANITNSTGPGVTTVIASGKVVRQPMDSKTLSSTTSKTTTKNTSVPTGDVSSPSTMMVNCIVVWDFIRQCHVLEIADTVVSFDHTVVPTTAGATRPLSTAATTTPTSVSKPVPSSSGKKRITPPVQIRPRKKQRGSTTTKTKRI